MKLLLSLFVLTCFYTIRTEAQTSKIPKWMCEKGFWVIQSNIHTPKNATIYFYNNERELVYKEDVKGKRINPEKLKARKHLEAVLSNAVIAFKTDGVVKENQQLVVTKR